ncbi:MAG: lysylphosphatidylglycerol synthase domain-containing protein [Bacteroidia bacterium]
MKPEPSQYAKVLNIARLLLLPVTFGFIFYKLFYAYHFDDLVSKFHFIFSAKKILILGIVILLMVLNWTVESMKWRLLINKNEAMSFRGALSAVLSGIALSIITPNQIGDFAGRIIHLKKFDKIKGSVVTVIGHTAQVIMTLAFGWFALVTFFTETKKIGPGHFPFFFFLFLIFAMLAVSGYLKIHVISRFFKTKKINTYLSVFSLYTSTELSRVLFFALLRYTVFLAQYILLLRFYDVHLSAVQYFSCIASALFVQSFVPSFLLIDLGMRGATALYFFSAFTPDMVGVLLSAYSLWIINLMIPAFGGLISILKLNANR